MPNIEPSPAAVNPRRFRWRRLVQYRLRTLLLVTTIVAVWFGWWSYRAGQQRDVVAALKKGETKITYDFKQQKLAGPRFWPTWLVTLLGVDYFANVVRVDNLRSVDDDDGNVKAGLKGLKNLTALKVINIDRIFSDADLEQVKGLSNLRMLLLTEAEITDAGLVHLKGLTALEALDLSGTHVTDSGMIHINSHTGLRSLSLNETQITDAGVEHIKRLTALRDLDLRGTQITDTGLDGLTSLSALESLDLESTAVTDAGLLHVNRWVRLERLILNRTKVGDGLLENLRHSTALKCLEIRHTRVTDAGISRLKETLPRCEIISDRTPP